MQVLRTLSLKKNILKNLPPLKHVTRTPDSSYEASNPPFPVILIKIKKRSKEIRQANGSIITSWSPEEMVWFIMKITSSPFSTNFKGTKVTGKQGGARRKA